MLVIILFLGCMLAAVSPASGQQGVNSTVNSPAAKPEAGPKSADPSTIVGELYDKELQFRFRYPVEMQVLDSAAEMESGHRQIYGLSGDNDPEHQQAKHCIRPLLDAKLPPDKAPQRLANLNGIWVDDSKQYKDSRQPEPIFAQIFVAEVLKGCLPKKLGKNENDALGNIAMSFVSLPGIQRMPNPLWYQLGTQKVHMNSGAGRLILNGNLSSAPIIIMSMTTQWRGHLLAWIFTSNDTEIFNEITKSIVQFGDGVWSPMFGATLAPKGAGGTQMTILPK